MKKSFIYALIVLISLSMLGLIAIQFYWIGNSVTLRDAQFRRNVKVALTEVNGILERQEKLHRLQKLNYGKLKFHIDSLRASSAKNPIVLEPGSAVVDSDHYANDNGQMRIEVYKNTQQANFTAISNSGDIDEILKKQEQLLEQNLKEQYPFDDFASQELAELIYQFQMLEEGSNFLNRYTNSEIDSLLNFALAEYGGIHTEFHYGIFDGYNNALSVPDRSTGFIERILDDGYKMRLLPKDYFTAPTYLHLWFPGRDTYLIKTLWPLLTSSSLFLITIIIAFSYTIRTILRQKKVSEIRNDFINNMTHELKTPIATISLACEALNDPVMSSSTKSINQYVGMIRDENKRLGVLVENVLKSAVLDRGDMELSRDDIDLHQIIKSTIKNIELQALKKGGTIQAMLKASNSNIKGDKVHLTNVIYNLLDNAIKYSSKEPRIEVETTCDENSIKIKVKDHGIGIKKEEQSRIFDKLYRVPTGNVHDIKGFGLGLSYVKVIVEKHHGTVSVASELGKGSTFTIQLPFDYEL